MTNKTQHKPVVLICSDRDGTITVDDDYYLGKDAHWQQQIEFYDGVIQELAELSNNQDFEIYFNLVTNQSGVALNSEGFEKLTLRQMKRVGKQVELNLEGAIQKAGGNQKLIRPTLYCPFVDSDYAEKAIAKGRTVDYSFLWDSCPDLKPKPGMIFQAQRGLYEKVQRPITYTFMIGDRYSDIRAGMNAGVDLAILVDQAKTKPQDIADARHWSSIARTRMEADPKNKDTQILAEQGLTIADALKSIGALLRLQSTASDDTYQ